MSFDTTEAYANYLDTVDELSAFRSHFYHRAETIYLDGNSLGLLSSQAEAAVLRALDEWKTLGIDGWMQANPPWFFLAEELGKRTAALVGAEPDEVIITNSTTVNLHQLLATFYEPTSSRPIIVADALAFPSDLYALRSHLRLRGRDPETDLRLVQSRDGLMLDEADILAAMTDDIQMIVLSSVLFQSGQLLDMERLTAEAHDRGIVVGFDCSHSIGVVPHEFDGWKVDFAFWCSYKYLNGGPGAVGGLYLNRRHSDRAPGLAGWFGSRKDRQFDLSSELDSAVGAGALQIGTPHLLSMAPLQGALELIEEAGIDRLRLKSLQLTDYLMALADRELTRYGFAVATPREEERRGGHVALLHEEAVRICKALKDVGVIPDMRPPHIVRLAPVPLYTRFHECWSAIQRLKRIMEQQSFQNYPTQRSLVS